MLTNKLRRKSPCVGFSRKRPPAARSEACAVTNKTLAPNPTTSSLTAQCERNSYRREPGLSLLAPLTWLVALDANGPGSLARASGVLARSAELTSRPRRPRAH